MTLRSKRFHIVVSFISRVLTHRLYLIKISRLALVASTICVVGTNLASAQWMGKQTGCHSDHIAANPNRPTVSNPAHVTQYGVVELEYGWDHFWPTEGTNQTSAGGLLKFGLLCTWSSAEYDVLSRSN
jgi:hypothetical protein